MRISSLILFTTSLMACRSGPSDKDDTGEVELVDADGDGFLNDVDCDDTNAEINPYASETCDEIDNDCDGLVDDEDDNITGTSSWYSDADGDGFGDADSVVEACAQPSGLIEDATDCDDLDFAINPGADEICDEIDNDCDELIDIEDDSITDASVWYTDADGDGFGSDDSEQNSCEEPSGGVEIGGDCNDEDDAIHPEALEVCDEIDNDCDELIDDEDDDLTDANTYYTDADGDGFGDLDTPIAACSLPSGAVEDDTDCDDSDATINPDAEEICDEIDNNCDAIVDTDATDIGIWYADADSDGFGDAISAITSCTLPSGYTDNDEDCDDSDSALNPDAEEICDEIDNDCDDAIDDEDSDLATDTGDTFYADADGDGFGNASDTTMACEAPSGFTSDDTDCDDGDDTINTAAEEVCDSIDNDCDGDIDDDDGDVTDQTTWFADTDEDGYGSIDDSYAACEQPSGYVADSADCDDADATVSPDAAEVCNDGIDNDCDGSAGTTDEGGSCELTDMSLNDSQLIMTGVTASDVSGSALAWLGDVDGDGTDDFAIGAPYEDTAGSATGSTYIMTNIELDYDDNETRSLSDSMMQFTGVNVADHSGQSLAGGDMNGDGYGDIWIGAPREDSGGYGSGSAYLVEGPFSSASSDLSNADQILVGDAANDFFGWGLDASGDIDGDGCADALISGPQDPLASGGASSSASGGGITYVYSGASLYPSDCSGDEITAQFYSSTAGDAAGYSLGFMDSDGDGVDEIVIGAPDSDLGAGANSGAVYLMSAPSDGDSTELGTGMVSFAGESYYDRMGWDVAGNGDINGDGYEDLFISAELDDDGGLNAGGTYLWLGPITMAEMELAPGDADAKITGAVAGDRSGYGLSYAGDIDGDGNDEILIGAWKAEGDESTSGSVHMLMGPISGTVSLSDADATFGGTATGDQVGPVIAGGGDFDADGTPDILIGARNNDDGASEAGAAYLILGLSQ